jgi:hypothetical protein
MRIPATADTAIINSSTSSKKECSFMQAANHYSLETLTAPFRAVILDTSSKSATEIVLRFRPVHKRVVAVPYPDRSGIIRQSRLFKTEFKTHFFDKSFPILQLFNLKSQML